MKNLSKKKKVIIIVSVCLIAVIALAGGILLSSSKTTKTNNKTTTKETVKKEKKKDKDTVTKSNLLKEKKYLVSFDTDGGSVVEPITVGENEKLSSVPTPTKSGYLFDKWTLDGKEFSFNTKIEKDITLKATWKKDSKKITKVVVSFDTDGGSNINSVELEQGKTIGKLPTPTKDGYTFIGWYLNNEKFSENSKINSNITLKASWKKINYGTFNLDTLAISKYTYTDLENKFGQGEWRSTSLGNVYNSAIGRIYYTSTYVRYNNGYYAYFYFYSYEGADNKEDIKQKTPNFIEFVEAKDIFNDYTDELINDDEKLKALGATNFEYFPERNFKRFRFADYSIDISKRAKGDYDYSEKSLVSIEYLGKSN